VDDLTPATGVGTVVLVEGVSDHAAVTTLAQRRGRDLESEGVAVVAMGGATNIAHFLRRYGPSGEGLRLAGLYDTAEGRFFRRAVSRAGLTTDPTGDPLARLGFFGCDRDLEDELIRHLGVGAVQRVLEEQGELGLFRTFQRQPAQREKDVVDQLRRFLGTHSGRKEQYARALVQALDPVAAPPPLEHLLGRL
jgi:hypothetical protein